MLTDLSSMSSMTEAKKILQVDSNMNLHLNISIRVNINMENAETISFHTIKHYAYYLNLCPSRLGLNKFCPNDSSLKTPKLFLIYFLINT